MRQDFAGQTVLITGSTSGIGRETARRFAACGACVIITGRDRTRGEEAVAEIARDGGRAHFVAADLSDAGSVLELARQALDLGGGHVDVLVNNASLLSHAATADVKVDEFDAVMAVNVRAPLVLVGALAPGMAERGDGAIVNVTTIVANRGIPGFSVYGSSKAALQMLTKSWAAEFGSAGVRVNAVSPGPTRTEGMAGYDDMLEATASQAPANQVGTPQDVARAIVFLASPGAGMIHGAVLPVDGGRLAV
ncbi:short-subunit dehydrogenase [Streptomyces sp. Ag109_O5-1]|uniref:SDR family NAD(P)-dependent oxidoreductase n=1 Tax=Streptomyces sp. Ag109_O5-1 TaxID=1938851 RepID=UPI000F4ECC04|nr:SDR family oxidoreductase [Streptomyces sp. Ag109_O5-1]RPE39947.1 short-subunit dehydrogenase [Streptomyces sp. Ag109_O5-1]